MILLEYEAKHILSSFSIPVPRSVVVHSVNDVISTPVVLKSQVPVGGRGKAGGVRVITDPDDVASTLTRLFSLAIKGHTPRTILAEELLTIDRELYLSIQIDRASESVQLMAHTSGGVDVESNVDGFLRLTLDELPGDIIGEQLAELYGLESHSFVLSEFVRSLYRCFNASDATLIEINPLVLTTEGTLVAGDCKMTLDDAAAFRHADWQFETKAAETNFVTLDPKGTIATIANGAGLAMATVDAVYDAGMTPANFLDIGGGATTTVVLGAFRDILKFPNIKGIIINIFAGITRSDEVARAIIEARATLPELPPLYIRLSGTNTAEAKALLDEQSIPLLSTLEACVDAAKKETAA